ncbi:MAG: hypothetical protein JOZ86_09270 [Candidatus Eremiobacteraeota bacterium]|nr:hypothetical protein [Candidatus Eremiobacteraeota bacterium]
MRTLYAETNFLVGYAAGQRAKFDVILQAASTPEARIRVPEVCVMEALVAIDRKIAESKRFATDIGSRLRDLRISVSSTSATTAAKTLEQARVDLATFDDDVLARRDHALTFLAAHGAFFSFDAAWFRDAARRGLIAAQRDSLILSAVLRDAALLGGDALFITENKLDFDTPSVRGALLATGVKWTDDAGIALAFMQGHRRWSELP